MLYEVLATLWHGPANDLQVARSIEDRTGEPFSRQAADRYLRTLYDCGYVDARGDQLSPSYALNNDGSLLLSRMARSIETREVIHA